jgi:serine/threonine-protein kinase
LTRRPDGSSSIKVLDFGISKAVSIPGDSHHNMGLTKTATVMGSPLYMSPEQMRSTRNVDARTDIWAMGVILYELVGGRVPFEADTMPELCALILTEPPRPITLLRKGIPPQLESAIMRCLEKDPARRFANISELALVLAPLGSEHAQVSARRISRILGPSGAAVAPAPRSGVTVEAHAAGGSTAQAWSDWKPPSRPSKGTVIGVAGAVVVLGAVGVFALTRSSRKTPSTDAAAVLAPSAATPAIEPPTLAAPLTKEPEVAEPAPPAVAQTPAASASAKARPPASVSARPNHEIAPARPASRAAEQVSPPTPAKKNPLSIDLK